MDTELDGILTHLIRQIGASSVPSTYDDNPPPPTNPSYDGKEEDSKENPTWKSIDESDAFIPANPKSTEVGVNANEKKDDYVFGNGRKTIFFIILYKRTVLN